VLQVANWRFRATFARAYAAMSPGLADRPPMPRIQLTEPRDVLTVVQVPDMQIGYLWTDHHTYLDPFHDRVALDALVEFVRRESPDVLHLAGDNLDLCAMGTYERDPRTDQTLSQALREYRWWVERFREAAPHARIVMTPGNHEARWKRTIWRSNPQLVSMVPDPMRWLLIDADNPHGCRLGNVGVEMPGDYDTPAYLWDGALMLAHGQSIKPDKIAERTDARIVLHGHTHKLHATPSTIRTARGPRTKYVASGGCACRLDGAVPGVSLSPDWQQGTVVARWEPRNERVAVTAYPIDRGSMLTAPGGPITGRDRSVEIAEACGVPQFVRRQAT